MFILGVCWFLAELGVYVRDLSKVTGFLLILWFFPTPNLLPGRIPPPGDAGPLQEPPY